MADQSFPVPGLGVRKKLVDQGDGTWAEVVALAGGGGGGLASGITASASFTPIAGAIGAADVMGAAKEFAFTYANGVAIPAGSLIRILTTIIKIDATALIASEGAYTGHCYSATPPSAQADNDLWTLASADLPSYRGSLALGTPVDLGSALYIKTPVVDLDIKLTTSSLWMRLVTVAGFTVPSTPPDRQVLLYGLVV